jgi:hypothetical protein
MALDNATVLENLLKQKAELEQQSENIRVTYLKVLGAIDVLSQIEGVEEGDAETTETEVVEEASEAE